MSNRRKLPEPLSAADAFWNSIIALGPDSQGQTRWERAAAEVRRSVSQIKKCATGEHPIRLDHAEHFDNINLRAGGPALNSDALRERLDRMLEGLDDYRGPDPVLFLDQALRTLKDAIRAVEFGKGVTNEIQLRFRDLHRLQSDLLEALSVRTRQESLDRERRVEDRKPHIVKVAS